MIYLVVQDWSNTANNHAGIKYLCNRLQQKHPDEFEVISIPDFYQGFSVPGLKREFRQLKILIISATSQDFSL